MSEIKICTICKQEKYLTEFNKTKQVKSGLNSHCKSCRSTYAKEYRKINLHKMRLRGKEWEIKNPLKKLNSYYKSNHGISLNEYHDMVAKQNNECAICERTSSLKLCVDHDHERGIIRGLLCRSCNGALGVLGDNKESLFKVIKYLEKI